MGDSAPLVSIITPAYNVENYIADCIKSILNQTYTNFEFIILDDASTDDTWQLITNFAQQDSRIKAIKNEKNLYIAANRNKGLGLAQGEYIVWQDADDISLPTRIEKLVAAMETDLEIGICGSYLQSFNATRILDIRKYAITDSELRKDIFKFSPVAQPAAIIRKKCFDELGDYNPSYPPAEDLDMSFRIGTKYKFANVPEVLLRYREHSQSSTFQKIKKQLHATLEIRKIYAKHPAYNFTLSDSLAYFLTYIMTLLPAKLVIFLFKGARIIVKSPFGILFRI